MSTRTRQCLHGHENDYGAGDTNGKFCWSYNTVYSGVFTVIPIYPVAIIKIIENGEFELPKATVKLCVD